MSLPSIRDVEAALAAAGLSRRQRRALLRGGWRAVVGEQEAEIQELRAAIDELAGGIGKIASPSPVAVAQDAGLPVGDAPRLLP